MKFSFNKIRSNRFIKDTAILTTGVGIAQILPIIAYPILSRLYTPDDFGLLAPITSIIAILGIIVTLKYENAILITNDERDCSILVLAILIVATIILAITEVAILIFAPTFSELLNDENLRKWLWVCPISAACVVLFNCFNEWSVRNGLFKTLAINKIINGFSLPAGKLSFAFPITRSFGLIIGDLVGHLITGISCYVRMIGKDKAKFAEISICDIKRLLRKYIDCPKYLLPGQLLNKVAYELPVFILMAKFSATSVGYYSMAVMVLALPTIVIGRSIGDTFRKKSSDIMRTKGAYNKFYLKIVGISFCLSFVGFSILYFIAPTLFSVVLGNKWVTSGYFCQIMCPMLTISFVSQIVSSVYIISEKMKILLCWQLLYFISTIVGIYIGWYYYRSIEATIIGLVIGRSIAHAINIAITYFISLKTQI